MQEGTLLAAIDMGSNSFRLEVGKLQHGQIQRIEYLKETVRQGAGLDKNSMLSKEAMRRGWDCLERFAERLRGMELSHVRAVATQTLREARNSEDFTARARQILGVPIEVIAGREEARLIYSGVAHQLPPSDERRVVVDIGGRSTEFILGTGTTPEVTESYQIGSVSWSMRYFADGVLSAKRLNKARIAARAQFSEIASLFPPDRWDVAFGCSGTVGAVAGILEGAGFESETITRKGLEWILQEMVSCGHTSKLSFAQLKDRHRDIIGGGISVLHAAFELLEMERMHVSKGALRHGMLYGTLYDVLDKELEATDPRYITVMRLINQFSIDTEQADRVRTTARHFFNQIHTTADTGHYNPAERTLGWAAALHEIGTVVSHNYYHRHGAYIIEHADAPGFSQSEQRRLGLLILGQRGKLRKVQTLIDQSGFRNKLICLRLALRLCHARRDPELDGLRLTSDRKDHRYTLHCTADWQQRHPQSAFLLQEEALTWSRTDYQLNISSTGS